MLEEIAIRYVDLAGDNPRLLSYTIVVSGAIVAAIFHKSSAELLRAPYFVYSGLMIFVGTASQVV